MVETVVPFSQLGTIHVSSFPNLAHGSIFGYDVAGITHWGLKVRLQTRPGENPDGVIDLFPPSVTGASPYLTRPKPEAIKDVAHFQGVQLRPAIDTRDILINAEPMNGELVSDGANFHLCATDSGNRIFFNFQTGHVSAPIRYIVLKRWTLVAGNKAEEVAIYEYKSMRDQGRR
jgi:hypothetical protein